MDDGHSSWLLLALTSPPSLKVLPFGASACINSQTLKIPHLMWKPLGLPKFAPGSECPGSTAQDVKQLVWFNARTLLTEGWMCSNDI